MVFIGLWHIPIPSFSVFISLAWDDWTRASTGSIQSPSHQNPIINVYQQCFYCPLCTKKLFSSTTKSSLFSVEEIFFFYLSNCVTFQRRNILSTMISMTNQLLINGLFKWLTNWSNCTFNWILISNLKRMCLDILELKYKFGSFFICANQ